MPCRPLRALLASCSRAKLTKAELDSGRIFTGGTPCTCKLHRLPYFSKAARNSSFCSSVAMGVRCNGRRVGVVCRQFGFYRFRSSCTARRARGRGLGKSVTMHVQQRGHLSREKSKRIHQNINKQRRAMDYTRTMSCLQPKARYLPVPTRRVRFRPTARRTEAGLPPSVPCHRPVNLLF